MPVTWSSLAPGPIPTPTNSQLAAALGAAIGADVYAESLAVEGGAVVGLARRDLQKSLLIAWPAGLRPAIADLFTAPVRQVTLPVLGAMEVLEAPRAPETAAALRRALPWTAPQLVAGRPSIGLGDRLGLATPGHVLAVRGTGYVPMLAQQSMREMTRTQRSAQQVIDDATWGVFQTGFRTGFGADADHLKATDAIGQCAAAGFLCYTIDPGDHVDNAADAADEVLLETKFDGLPWTALETTPADTERRYAGLGVDLGGGHAIAFDAGILQRAAVKYGRAVAHTAALYRHLVATLGRGRFELEVSVDETDTPTSPAEHYYVAQELRRMGVGWVSLAPRFVGRFEKGVDYIGDLRTFEADISVHAAIARHFGPYKLSLHSGSDQFSIYGIAARHAQGEVHLKTAGTSYLEALRVIARCEGSLFREILDFARYCYPADRATYNVSASIDRVPIASVLADNLLPGMLDHFDTREVLHVTFGSVLTEDGGRRFRGRLLGALQRHEEAYAEALRRHIGRHLAAFLKNV